MRARVACAASVMLVVLAACNSIVGVHPLDAYEDGSGGPDGSRDSFAVSEGAAVDGEGGVTDADADAQVVCDESAIAHVDGVCKTGTEPGWVNLCKEPDAGSYVFRTFPERPKANTSFTVHLLTGADDSTWQLMVGNGAYCAGGSFQRCEPGTCCSGKFAYRWQIGGSLGAGTKKLEAFRYATAPATGCDSNGRLQVLTGEVTIDP